MNAQGIQNVVFVLHHFECAGETCMVLRTWKDLQPFTRVEEAQHLRLNF